MKENKHQEPAQQIDTQLFEIEDEAFRRDMGRRLKEIREILGFTLTQISTVAGTSVSYISDFERGKKIPTSRYLLSLAGKYRASITYIYLGKGEIFLPEKDEDLVDFGNYTDDIKAMLQLMKRIPSFMFFMLQQFSNYKIEQRQLIKKVLDDDSGEV